MIGEVVAVNDSEIYVKEKGVRRISVVAGGMGKL